MKLYVENETNDSPFDSGQVQETHEFPRLGTVAATGRDFHDEPVPNIEYYAVPARGHHE